MLLLHLRAVCLDYGNEVFLLLVIVEKLKLGMDLEFLELQYTQQKSITIGKNATIGANCKIIDNDFHPLDRKIVV